MNIYTKTGDNGQTGLFGGQRIHKSHPRIHAYGTIDELNAQLGVVLAHPSSAALDLYPFLQPVQQELFVIGSHLSTPYDPSQPAPPSLPELNNSCVQRLEAHIDQLQATLPELKQFIIPGGTLTASSLHVARTVCRRAERMAVELSQIEEIAPVIIQYLNRLSDLLFVLARAHNHSGQQTETTWNPDTSKQ